MHTLFTRNFLPFITGLTPILILFWRIRGRLFRLLRLFCIASKDYEYEPLNKEAREIRLIKLYPADPSNNASSPIECSIIKASLQAPPTYTALSYCWGDATTLIPILLDKRSLSVTPNLHDALYQLRVRKKTLKVYSILRRLRRKTVITLWIDAICINQKNISERNHQITLMRDIYTMAENTIVWLGEKADDSKFAFNLIHDWFSGYQKGLTLQTFLQEHTLAFNERRWQAFELLLHRP